MPSRINKKVENPYKNVILSPKIHQGREGDIKIIMGEELGGKFYFNYLSHPH
jgi:hypothetical protein